MTTNSDIEAQKETVALLNKKITAIDALKPVAAAAKAMIDDTAAQERTIAAAAEKGTTPKTFKGPARVTSKDSLVHLKAELERDLVAAKKKLEELEKK
jgi:hypothetical protein